MHSITPSSESRMEWDEMLGRSQRVQDHNALPVSLRGKRVLITGGAGYIGSALAETIHRCRPQRLILLDASEQGIYGSERRLARSDDAITTCILGNILDTALLSHIFRQHRPHVVFHAAAFKHVPLLEKNPLAAIANNTIGTAQLAEISVKHGCEQFILLSTDKAVEPVSILGASKRIAELVVFSLAGGGTRMKSVRLGNVLGSPGSIVPMFFEQIARGDAVTVTHREAERYFVTLDEAVAALCSASATASGDGIYVPEMGQPVRILSIAQQMISRLSKGPEGHRVTFTGLRPGDKLTELVVAGNESIAEESVLVENGISLRSVFSPSVDSATLAASVDRMTDAVNHGSVAEVLQILEGLLPDYHPSPLLSAQASLHSHAAATERL